MTQYRYVFRKKDMADDVTIVEKRVHGLDGVEIKTIEQAVDVGYGLAETRGWFLVTVEEL